MNWMLTEHLKGFLVKKYFPDVVQQRNEKYERVSFCKQSLFLFCKPLMRTNRARNHPQCYLVQYLENIGPATEQSDWLNVAIGSLAA